MFSVRRLMSFVALMVLAALMAACGGSATPESPAATEAPAAPTTPPDPLAGWIEYTADDQGFTARLPKQPDVQSQTVPTEAGDIEIVMYVVEQGDGALLVSHNELPPQLAEMVTAGDAEVTTSMLDGGRDGALANVSGVLQSEQEITVDGISGRDINFTVDGSNSPTGKAIDGRARILVTPQRLWQILALASQGEMNEKQVNAFFESFKIAVGE